jgi:hypothetical protein
VGRRKSKSRKFPDQRSCREALTVPPVSTIDEDVRQGRGGFTSFPLPGTRVAQCRRRDCAGFFYPAYYVQACKCEDCRSIIRLEAAQKWERFERRRDDGTYEPAAGDRADSDAGDRDEDPRREVQRYRALVAYGPVRKCRQGRDRIILSGKGEDRGGQEFATFSLRADGVREQLVEPEPPGPNGAPKPRVAA